MSKDWMTEAATEIWDGRDAIEGQSFEDQTLEWMLAIIAKHCPFKPDTAYISVDDAKREAEQAREEGYQAGYNHCAGLDDVDDRG